MLQFQALFFDVKEKRDYEMQLFNRTINFALLMFVSIIVLIVLIIIGLIIIYKTRQRRVIHKRRRISKKTEPSDTKKEKDIEDIVEEISKNQEQKQ